MKAIDKEFIFGENFKFQILYYCILYRQNILSIMPAGDKLIRPDVIVH